MKHAAIDIRRADPSDAEALTELARLSKASWGYPEAWLARWDDELTLTGDDIRRWPTFVVWDAEVPVAMYVLERTGRDWSLEHLWVRPDHQGRGLGRALFEHALRTIRDRHPAALVVLSDPHAEPFYRRLGGVRVGQAPAPMPGAPDRVLPRLRFEPAR